MLQLADSRIDTFGDRHRFQVLVQRGQNAAAGGFGVHGLGQRLDGEQVVVAIHDQPGQEIAFAEDDAVSIGVAHHALSVGDRSLNALP